MDPTTFVAPVLRLAMSTAVRSRRRIVAGSDRRRSAQKAGRDTAAETMVRLTMVREYGLLDRRPGYQRLLYPPWDVTPFLGPVLRDAMLGQGDMAASYYELCAAERDAVIAAYEAVMSATVEMASAVSKSATEWEQATTHWTEAHRAYQEQCQRRLLIWKRVRRRRKKA